MTGPRHIEEFFVEVGRSEVRKRKDVSLRLPIGTRILLIDVGKTADAETLEPGGPRHPPHDPRSMKAYK